MKCSSISCMYGEVFVSTISLVFLLLMAFLKLVAKIIYQVCLGEFHDFSWMFWSRHCSRKGARRVEERKKKEERRRRRKKKTKMTKLDFHRFQVRHFSNSFEQSPCYCKMGQRQRADPCLKTSKIQHEAKYQRLNANTLYVAAILFSRSSLHRETLPCLPNNWK